MRNAWCAAREPPRCSNRHCSVKRGTRKSAKFPIPTGCNYRMEATALQQPALFRETRDARSSPFQLVVTIAAWKMEATTRRCRLVFVVVGLNNAREGAFY